jgi:hypothetical protein
MSIPSRVDAATAGCARRQTPNQASSFARVAAKDCTSIPAMFLIITLMQSASSKTALKPI